MSNRTGFQSRKLFSFLSSSVSIFILSNYAFADASLIDIEFQDAALVANPLAIEASNHVFAVSSNADGNQSHVAVGDHPHAIDGSGLLAIDGSGLLAIDGSGVREIDGSGLLAIDGSGLQSSIRQGSDWQAPTQNCDDTLFQGPISEVGDEHIKILDAIQISGFNNHYQLFQIAALNGSIENGFMRLEELEISSTHVDGASNVVFTGVIAAIDESLAELRVGQVTVEYSMLENPMAVNRGDLITISGILFSPQHLIKATKLCVRN